MYNDNSPIGHIPPKNNAVEADRVHYKQMIKRLNNKTNDQLKCVHPLSKIANKYKALTDKGPTTQYWRKHTYTEFYGPLLTHLRNEPLRILEIGVRWGGSLAMWHDFFPNATIYGVDIIAGIHSSLKHQLKDIVFIKGDAYSREFANMYFKNIKFDIILDDGSHKENHQIKMFNIYKDFLVDGGYLMCEDFPTISQAKKVIDQFEGPLNNISLIDRTHCIPSTKGEIIVMYKH